MFLSAIYFVSVLVSRMLFANPSNRTHSFTLVAVDTSPPEIHSSGHDGATKTHLQQLDCQNYVKIGI